MYSAFMPRQRASTLATGGGGYTFADKVAAAFLTQMLKRIAPFDSDLGQILELHYATLVAAGRVARNPKGPDAAFDPEEPGHQKKVHRGGSFLCTDQYCSRYIVGTRSKGDIDTGTNHLSFRCVKNS